MGSVGTIVDDVSHNDDTHGKGEAYFGARDRESVGGNSRSEDLAYDEGCSLGENPNVEPNGGPPSHLKMLVILSAQTKVGNSKGDSVMYKGGDETGNTGDQEERSRGQDCLPKALLLFPL